MTNNTINIEALAEEFKVECKVIKLGYEYPGYTGTEKYAIVTDLSYAQIMERYAPIAEHYCPFLLLSKAAGEVIADYKRNEDKFSKRMQKDDCYGFEDGMTEPCFRSAFRSGLWKKRLHCLLPSNKAV